MIPINESPFNLNRMPLAFITMFFTKLGGQRFQGEVVNIMPYGAFVKLEPGIEGLVHISEMSWVKRIADPKELVQIGDKVQGAVIGAPVADTQPEADQGKAAGL